MDSKGCLLDNRSRSWSGKKQDIRSVTIVVSIEYNNLLNLGLEKTTTAKTNCIIR